jgi:hypothetical protein
VLLAFDIPFYAHEQHSGVRVAVLAGLDCRAAIESLIQQDAGRDMACFFTDESSAITFLCSHAAPNA